MIAQNHAQENAAAWFETISAMVEALQAAREKELLDEDQRLPQCAFPDCDTPSDEFRSYCTQHRDEDVIREAIEESALSVEIRSGWVSVGQEKLEPTEYCILMTTGGPALRIIGDLSEHGEPITARLEYQDWGTYWTESHITGASGENEDTLLTFASVFYFGD